MLLPVCALNDRRQAVELEPDQYSTKMWSCFLDVTPVLAPVMRVFETLNKIYKLLNVSLGQRSHEGLRHQGHPDDIVPEGKSNSVKQRSMLSTFSSAFSASKSFLASPTMSPGARVAVHSPLANWRLCSPGVVVLSKVVSFSMRLFTLVASHWTSAERSTNMPAHAPASNSKLFVALNDTDTLHTHQTLGKIQVFCSGVCCELSDAVHLNNINLDIGQAPGNIPVRVLTSFFNFAMRRT